MELLYCDRVEEGIAVLLGRDGTVYEAEENLLRDGKPLEGGHFLCDIRDGRLLSAGRVKNPSAGENRKRLSALFRKTKNKEKNNFADKRQNGDTT